MQEGANLPNVSIPRETCCAQEKAQETSIRDPIGCFLSIMRNMNTNQPQRIPLGNFVGIAQPIRIFRNVIRYRALRGELQSEKYATDIDAHPNCCSDTIAEGNVYRYFRRNPGVCTRSESIRALVECIIAGMRHHTGKNGADNTIIERLFSIIRMFGLRRNYV